MVKQEMARVNVYILGISELKWTGMGEFNSDDHYTTVGRNPQAVENHRSTFYLHFPVLDILYKWNHAICSLVTGLFYFSH